MLASNMLVNDFTDSLNMYTIKLRSRRSVACNCHHRLRTHWDLPAKFQVLNTKISDSLLKLSLMSAPERGRQRKDMQLLFIRGQLNHLFASLH